MTDPEFPPKSLFCPFDKMKNLQFAQNPKGKMNPELPPNLSFCPFYKMTNPEFPPKLSFGSFGESSASESNNSCKESKAKWEILFTIF